MVCLLILLKQSPASEQDRKPKAREFVANIGYTAKSKKQRQRTAKALRKRALLNPDSLVPKIPVYEQSVDLPGGDGSLEGAKQAGEARGGLTKAMRDKRRKGIKEDNFLRAMG
jgi:large subunit ribosomal protein L54